MNKNDTEGKLNTDEVLSRGYQIGNATGRLEKSVEVIEKDIQKLQGRLSFLERLLLLGTFSALLYAVMNNWTTLKEVFFSLVLRFLR